MEPSQPQNNILYTIHNVSQGEEGRQSEREIEKKIEMGGERTKGEPR